MISKIGNYIKFNIHNKIIYIPSNYVNNIKIQEICNDNMLTIITHFDIDKQANIDSIDNLIFEKNFIIMKLLKMLLI
jgi:hypothetical protein